MRPLERVRKLAFAKFKQDNPGDYRDYEDKVKLKYYALARPVRWFPVAGLTDLTLEPTNEAGSSVQPFSIATERSKLRRYAEGSVTLHDQTVLAGKLSAEKRFLTIQVDKVDARSTPVPENSMIWDYLKPEAKVAFEEHRAQLLEKAEEHGKMPKHNYHLVKKQDKHDGHYPEVRIPFDEVTLYSNFTPKWNTYLAVYFTITGLHGLHVLVGALILAYFMFFGKKMFDEDPEHLANRVEVGGLFWHFVDLVWIFLFPILYLM